MSDPVFTYDVFLSHSAEDKAMVRPLAERLRQDGVKVWFDGTVLKAASRTWDRINRIDRIPAGDGEVRANPVFILSILFILS